MTQSSVKSRWLLAVCGVLDALIAILIVVMGNPDGSANLRTLIHGRGAVSQLGLLALASGACTIAASIWGSKKDNSWLLMLNGLACSSLGLLVTLGATRQITFRTIALVMVIVAMSIGLYELTTARTLRRHPADEWLFGAAGVVSVGFAVAFLAFVLRWIKLDPSPSGRLSIGSARISVSQRYAWWGWLCARTGHGFTSIACPAANSKLAEPRRTLTIDTFATSQP